MSDLETQLEWFDLPHHASPSRGARILAQPLRMRPDHAVLGVILLLIGTSVVFAFGVERGKQVARTEPGIVEPSASVSQHQASATGPGETLATRPPTEAGTPPSGGVAEGRVPAHSAFRSLSDSSRSRSAETRSVRPTGGKGSAATSSAPNTVPKQPSPKPGKTIVPKSRFAVQVVSYRQLKLAKQELQRLQQRGEAAFLVSSPDRTVLLVGPFVNKERASSKLVSLKRRYQDCFVRAL